MTVSILLSVYFKKFSLFSRSQQDNVSSTYLCTRLFSRVLTRPSVYYTPSEFSR